MIVTTFRTALLALALMMFTHSTMAASVGSGGVSTAFSRNSTTLAIGIGSGTAFNDDYLILGVGAGYYVLQGLELGLSLQYWSGGERSISKVSPRITYVFTRVDPVKPYLGVFYRRTYIEDFDDQDSWGYRGGAYFGAGRNLLIGAGLVYEEYTDCSAFLDCSDTYPELSFTFSF